MPISVLRTDEYHTIEKTYDKYMTDEATLSHMLREPTELISSGLSYGGHLAKILSEKESFPEKPVILEIGAGLGHLGEGMSRYLRNQEKEPEYAILDICSNLLAGIRECKDDDFEPLLIRGDGTRLPFKEGAFNVVVCNEAVGDFTNVKLSKDFIVSYSRHLPDKIPQEDLEVYRDSIRMVRDYGIDLDDAPDEFIFNYGALRLVEEIGRIKPAIAFISENSSKGHNYPKTLPLKTHTECEVYFPHIEKVSSSLGFRVESGELGKLLGIDYDKKVIDHFFVDDVLRSLYKNGAPREEKDIALSNALDSIWYIFVTPQEFRSRLRKTGFDFNDSDFEAFFVKENVVRMGNQCNNMRYIILQRD